MNISFVNIIGFFLIAIGFCGLLAIVYRLALFGLTIFFGKNVKITYVDKNGDKKSKKYRIDNDDDLISLINFINKSEKHKHHFFGKEH
jgi:hypothetical protein